jgi:hypothetical protein
VFEVDERAVGPQPLPQLLPGDDVTRPLEHQPQNLEWLFLQPRASGTLAQLARPDIELEWVKPQ